MELIFNPVLELISEDNVLSNSHVIEIFRKTENFDSLDIKSNFCSKIQKEIFFKEITEMQGGEFYLKWEYHFEYVKEGKTGKRGAENPHLPFK